MGITYIQEHPACDSPKIMKQRIFPDAAGLTELEDESR